MSEHYRFGEFSLHGDTRQLRRHGECVACRPQVIDLLLHLIRNRERVVSREELADTIWAGVSVSPGAITTTVYEARGAVADDASRRAVIQTLQRRGYRFVAPVSTAAEPQPAAQGRVLVGRHTVLSSLQKGLESARGGRGRLVLLEGAPGAGKTATVRHFAAGARGFDALLTRCVERAAAPAWPWLRLLRELADADAPRGATPSAEPLAGIGLFESVTQRLRRAARERPLLLVLDDLHWADDTTLDLLRFAAVDLEADPVLLIATYRDDEPPRRPPLRAALADLARHAHGSRLRLDGLSEPALRELLACALAEAPDAELVRPVLRRTGGNAFFAKELAGLLAREAPERRGELARRGLPDTVRDVIRSRVERLSQPARDALALTAAAGDAPRLDVLERAWSRASGDLLAALDEATDARLLRPREAADGAVAFAQELIRDVVYESLGGALQAALHRRLAEALEAACAEAGGRDAAMLAHHFAAAAPGGGDCGKAVHYSRIAAERAVQREAWHAALELTKGGLALIPRLDPSPERDEDELALLHLKRRAVRGCDGAPGREAQER